jgi:hypothetical protein
MSAVVVHLPVVADLPPRPRTRGDCIDGPRPCPWTSCREHAIHGVLLGNGAASISDDDVVEMLAAMPATCTLDVADHTGRGAGGALRSVLEPVNDAGDEEAAANDDEGTETGADGASAPSPAVDASTLQSIAELWGVTRERIRQIEDKALRRLTRRVAHLREDIIEEPDVVLRPASGGAARFVEERRIIEAPAQHAHLPGPADVTEAAQPFWCGWIGTPMTGGLCAKRHVARTKASARNGGHAGGSWPTYPQCARCTDGAAVAARLGGGAELVPLRVAVPVRAIDWMGEGDGAEADVSEPDDSPAAEQLAAPALPEEEPEMKTAKTPHSESVSRGAAHVTAPAPGASCRFPGCTQTPANYRDTLDAVLRPFCTAHRTRAQGLRTQRQIGSAEAVAILLAGAGKQRAPGPRSPRAPAAPFVATASEPEATKGASRCEIDGCRELPAVVRAMTPAGTEALCIVHRERVLALSRKRGLDVADAITRLQVLSRAGIGPNDGPDAINRALAAAGIGTAPKPAAQRVAPEELAQVARERDEALAQIRAEESRCQRAMRERDDFRRDRDALALRLDAADVRIAELEGQQLADATVRPESSPWARIDALVRNLGDSAGDWRFTVYRSATGWRSEAVDAAGQRLLCGADGADPDAAAAGLLAAAEYIVRRRIEVLTAALGGARG